MNSRRSLSDRAAMSGLDQNSGLMLRIRIISS